MEVEPLTLLSVAYCTVVANQSVSVSLCRRAVTVVTASDWADLLSTEEQTL